MALLQIHATLLGPGLLSPATLSFYQSVCSIMPVLDRKPVGEDYDEEHHSRLVDRQHKNDNDALPMFAFILIGSAVAVQWEDGEPMGQLLGQETTTTTIIHTQYNSAQIAEG